MGVPLPHRDDRAALALEELASALDAGLPPDLTGSVQSLGIPLDPADRAVLAAAETAGELPRALRERAAARRQRADLSRQIMGKLAYPVLLTTTAAAVAIFVTLVLGLGPGPILLAVLGPILLAGLGLALRMATRSKSPLPLRLPVLGPILQDLGELPYLQTLRGLYAAGIPLLQAHPQAVATVAVAPMRADLRAADSLLQDGRPLAEALESAGALSRETRGLLATGETSGDLEGALERVAIRRADTLRHRSERGAKLLGAIVYGLAIAVAVYVIFSFYLNLYGQLGRR